MAADPCGEATEGGGRLMISSMWHVRVVTDLGGSLFGRSILLLIVNVISDLYVIANCIDIGIVCAKVFINQNGSGIVALHLNAGTG